MPDAFTPNFNLCKPEVGASRDTWGTKENANMDILDQYLGYAMPVGAILDYAGPQAPPGWLICDGRLVSRVTYSILFSVIGTYWGAGDGATTFALPPTPGRAMIGPGTVIDQAGNPYGFSFASQGGFVQNMIQQANLPNYNLGTDVQGWHNHGGATTAGGNHSHTTDVQGYHGHGVNDPGHGHGVNDPGHAHQYSMYNISGVGGYGSNALVVSSGMNPTTSTNGTGISIQGSGVGISIAGDGNHGHNISWTGDFIQLGIYGDGNHGHNVWLGGGGAWFETMGPFLVSTKIIYAGAQAAPSTMAAASTALTTTLDGRDELAAIRAQLAELQALLLTPPRQRRLAAPLRGPH